MSNFCNSLNIKTLKISQLREYNTVDSDDIFLVIESGDALYSRRTTFGNILNSLRYISASYVGSFTGSLLGTLVGDLSGNFTGNGTGNFQGQFTGSVLSPYFRGTGSLYSVGTSYTTGSFFGVNYITNFKNSGVNVSFNGTSSYSVSSSFAKAAITAKYLASSDGGAGVTDQFAFWESANTVGTTNYLSRQPTVVNKSGGAGGVDAQYFGNGRTALTKPLHFTINPNNQYILGEHLIFQSASLSTRKQSIYGMGMQENTLYLRTDANFIIYHSGSFANNDQIGDGYSKQRKINPGKNGSTVFSACERLVGIGWFKQTNDIGAQCHIHVSGSKGYRGGYDPNVNMFLITSGSITNRLLRVNGDGQLDVKGDIVALSTFSTSDLRLKKDIHPISNSIELINNLNPIKFNWISNSQTDYGLIAQEVEKNYPELIKEDMNGYKTVKYNSFIPLLIKSVQELQEQVEKLNKKIIELENK